MADTKPIVFRCIEVTQPIGTFYMGAMDSDDLFRIAYADVRRIEDRDVEKIIGIQRPLDSRRVEELKKYVTTVDASFPTSIILAVDGERAEYNEKLGVMRIDRDEKVAKIIDGQHRIAGLEGYKGRRFELNVTIFIDMELEDQALLFGTINLKQTRVNRSLAYDLYDFATDRSPQKTCHNIARLLNSKEGSPFKDRIKILGTATPGKRGETITQAAFVERLIRYLSRDPMKDRDLIKRGKLLGRAASQEARDLIFRNMFIDERDAEIARVVWHFFEAVVTRWPDAWSSTEKGNILRRSTGFASLMRLLRDAYLSFQRPEEVVEASEFEALFRRIQLQDDQFTTDVYKPGSSGEARLYEDLKQQAGL
jgi:DGQHR domain-containing protein